MRMMSSAKARGLLRVGIGAAVAIFAPAALAHEGHEETERYMRDRFANIELDAGAVEAYEAIKELVNIAADARTLADQPLLPLGTTVDRVEWVGTLLEIDLTLGATKDVFGDAYVWQITEIDAATISRSLAGPFVCDPKFSGVSLMVRRNSNAGYGSLAQFFPPQPKVEPVELPNEPFVPQEQQPGGLEGGIAGPVANAARQPTGALSGVTVFCAAGHGWTAGASSWFLQRAVLNGMCEDYGNIDQLNYFANFAFNAGATVVPMRPVGWQPIEIVLDQDDAGVTYTGAWSNGSSAKYFENGATNSGIPYKFANSAAVENATARYSPNITTTGFYPVYCFTIASTNRVPQIYRISHAGGLSEVTVDHRNVGNGWIWLGSYYFVAGGSNYVEISNQSATSGVVIADGIRFGGGYGDISRPGPNSISGYPRDEEAQRYWAQTVYGDNAVGFSSSIWDLSGSDDQSDNVGAGARAAAEMNQVPAGGVGAERWKRIYLEFHTNAFDTTSRGQLSLITDLGSTTNQTSLATILSDEVDADMNQLSSTFENAWVDRSSSTLTGSYGAIATTNNANEFDATLIELAFHDNVSDAQILRDPRVRTAMGRACVQGIIRFLHSLPGSTVPLAFPPSIPVAPRVIDQGGGNVQIAWTAPPSGGANGDAATGYVIYQSTNGYGFGSPIVVGNTTSYVMPGVPVGQTLYFRVAATNAGGESMPSEVLAVRRPTTGTADILIVNGFDRLRRQLNPTQTFTQPPAYAGSQIERQIWRESNSFDYVVQHAEALAANNFGFSSCANEAIINLNVTLSNFDNVVWILGEESTQDLTLNGSEQSALTTFLANGHGLFISGAEIAFDLIGAGTGSSFATSKLKIGYGVDNAGTSTVVPPAGGIFNGLASFSFDEASGAPYPVGAPDTLTLQSGAVACLNYNGGVGGIAAVQYTGPSYNTVTFGFPFECIGSPTARAQVMLRVINYLKTAALSLPFDQNNDGDVDWTDAQFSFFCLHGPGSTYPAGNACRNKCDTDLDADVDIADMAILQRVFTGPLP